MRVLRSEAAQNRNCRISRSAVDNYVLFIRIRLAGDAFDAPRQEFSAVIGGCDNTNFYWHSRLIHNEQRSGLAGLFCAALPAGLDRLAKCLVDFVNAVNSL